LNHAQRLHKSQASSIPADPKHDPQRGHANSSAQTRRAYAAVTTLPQAVRPASAVRDRCKVLRATCCSQTAPSPRAGLRRPHVAPTTLASSASGPSESTASDSCGPLASELDELALVVEGGLGELEPLRALAAVLAPAVAVGFEPARGDPIGLAGRRLSHSAKVSVAAPPRKSVPLYIAEPSANMYAQQLMLAHAHPRLCCQPSGCSPPPPPPTRHHHHRHHHRPRYHHYHHHPKTTTSLRRQRRLFPNPTSHRPRTFSIAFPPNSIAAASRRFLSFTLSYPPPPPRPRLPSPPPRTRTHTPAKPHVSSPRACYTLEAPSPPT